MQLVRDHTESLLSPSFTAGRSLAILCDYDGQSRRRLSDYLGGDVLVNNTLITPPRTRSTAAKKRATSSLSHGGPIRPTSNKGRSRKTDVGSGKSVTWASSLATLPGEYHDRAQNTNNSPQAVGTSVSFVLPSSVSNAKESAKGKAAQNAPSSPGSDASVDLLCATTADTVRTEREKLRAYYELQLAKMRKDTDESKREAKRIRGWRAESEIESLSLRLSGCFSNFSSDIGPQGSHTLEPFDAIHAAIANSVHQAVDEIRIEMAALTRKNGLLEDEIVRLEEQIRTASDENDRLKSTMILAEQRMREREDFSLVNERTSYGALATMVAIMHARERIGPGQ
ncbi:Hypothetical protein D9617_18g033750 [Elsinoe fawcettii]|nr:Hypothetical protein D9617_18g033750 [Elsinoe fawcettii]